jgi:hypothetical protein
MKAIGHAEAKLEQEGALGCLPAPPVGREVVLGKLSVLPEVFQQREALYSLSRSEEHIAELRRRIRSGTGMDPLTIWWSGQRWLVIEGHHRFEAYGLAAQDGGMNVAKQMVPVQVFSGTLVDAKEKAGEDNSKARLGLSKAERNQQAWKLYATGEERSPSKIESRTKISRQNVYRMKKAYATLIEHGHDPASMPWPEARHLSKGEPDEDGRSADYEKRRDEIVQRLFSALHKEFGKTWLRQSDAFAYGLARQHPRFAEMLVGSPHLEPMVDTAVLEREASDAEDRAMSNESDPLSPGYGDY